MGFFGTASAFRNIRGLAFPALGSQLQPDIRSIPLLSSLPTVPFEMLVTFGGMVLRQMGVTR